MTESDEQYPLDDPFEWFEIWLQDAVDHGMENPNAMALATIDEDGMPSVRTVLLKDHSEEAGFTFYTNLRSRKGRGLEANPRASVCFYWRPLDRQIRIQGHTEQVPDEEADAYWATRHRLSQIGAWASRQSETLASRAKMEERVDVLKARFEGGPVPRPSHWSGVRIIPRHMEFWVGRANRLHDRWAFTRHRPAPHDGNDSEEIWVRNRLYP